MTTEKIESPDEYKKRIDTEAEQYKKRALDHENGNLEAALILLGIKAAVQRETIEKYEKMLKTAGLIG